MPKLNWDVLDLIDYFAVLPEVEDYAVSHTFQVERDAVILTMQLWGNESIVHLTLSAAENETPFVSWYIAVKDRVALVGRGSGRFLKLTGCIPVPSRFYLSDWETNVFTLPLPHGGLTLDIRLTPSIALAYSRE